MVIVSNFAVPDGTPHSTTSVSIPPRRNPGFAPGSDRLLLVVGSKTVVLCRVCVMPVVITPRTSRPSSYARFKYPVKFHWSQRQHPLSCDVPDCLRRPSSTIYWMMPVRQGPRHHPAARPESPPGAPGRAETLPEVPQGDEEASPEPEPDPEPEPVVVVEVERSESNEVEVELPEQNVEAEQEETAEASQDQPDSAEQYDDEGFEKDTDDGGDETDSVTSTDVSMTSADFDSVTVTT